MDSMKIMEIYRQWDHDDLHCDVKKQTKRKKKFFIFLHLGGRFAVWRTIFAFVGLKKKKKESKK